VNACVALRARAADFAEWGEHGAEGWSFDEVLPAFRMLETTSSGDDAYHGRTGPLPIRQRTDGELTPSVLGFVEAAIAQGFERVHDFNGGEQSGADGYPVDVVDGVRQNVGLVYLTADVRRRPNLTILLRAGVGPADELTAMGIGVVADLPVGQRLQDQPGYYNAYALAPGYLEMTPAVGSLQRTASSEAAGDELDLHITATHLMDGSLSPTGGAIVLQAALVQPESTGTLKLASPDPGDAPLIDAHYLGTGRGARRMLEAVKIGRAIARNSVFAPFIAGELTPGDAVVGDDALAQVIADNLAVYGHPTSTVPMGGSGDPRAVVDSAGAVRGVSGLRVADASVIPEVPSSTTNVTVIMLAERIYQRVCASTGDLVAR
jgi:choline dehydrogenase